MSEEHRTASLQRLVELREREVERLGADMSARQATRNRYATNLARLEQLYTGSGASGAPSRIAGENGQISLSLSLNCASYKQAVMRMAAAHRVDLSLFEADMAVARRALLAATRRQEALGQELARQRDNALKAKSSREQKRQDDIALQTWRRGRK
jgi:flagellar export protein FliJ